MDVGKLEYPYIYKHISLLINTIHFRQIVNDKMLEGSTLDAQQEEMERKRRLEEVRAKLVAEQMAANETKQLEPEVSPSSCLTVVKKNIYIPNFRSLF